MIMYFRQYASPWWAVLFVSAIMLVGSSRMVLAESPSSGFWMITPEEAAMAAPVVEPDAIRERGFFGGDEPSLSNTGPEIQLKKPGADAAPSSPMEIEIQFIPRHAPVDLTTIKVTLVKIIDIDLTERVKPYVTEEGLHIKDANLPSGEHTVRVSLGDTNGGMTVTQLVIKVL